MHNGQVGGHMRVRRAIEAMIPDELYPLRAGTTDSEAIFLSAFAHGLEEDPIAAIASTLARIVALQAAAGISEPLRFAACLSDGETIWAFRWSSDRFPPTLYFRTDTAGTVIVSEPVDETHDDWQEVPKYNHVTITRGAKPVFGCLNDRVKRAGSIAA
jgi:glutamine amidotransferase